MTCARGCWPTRAPFARGTSLVLARARTAAPCGATSATANAWPSSAPACWPRRSFRFSSVRIAASICGAGALSAQSPRRGSSTVRSNLRTLRPIAEPSALVVAAPMAQARLRSLRGRYASLEVVIDLRAEGEQDPLPSIAPLISLADVFSDLRQAAHVIDDACRGGEGRDSSVRARLHDARQAESVGVARPVRVRLLSRGSALARLQTALVERALGRPSAARRAMPDTNLRRRSGSNLAVVEAARQGCVHSGHFASTD